MDITRLNFVESLPLIKKSIDSADFIAFDTEFSGLNIGFEDKQNDFDTVEIKYQKIKHNCQRMNAFQFGLTTFKWDSSSNQYMMRPINFWVFPSSKLVNLNPNVQFSVSAIDFLQENHFDFNKLFKEGLSYQRLCDSERVKKQILQHTDRLPKFNRMWTHIGQARLDEIQGYVERVRQFIKSCQSDDEEYKVLELEIPSLVIRKKLSRELADLYRDQRIIYTEYDQVGSRFTVRKWKTNKMENVLMSKFASDASTQPSQSSQAEAQEPSLCSQ